MYTDITLDMTDLSLDQHLNSSTNEGSQLGLVTTMLTVSLSTNVLFGYVALIGVFLLVLLSKSPVRVIFPGDQVTDRPCQLLNPRVFTHAVVY